jgi:putative PIN family toxin of toxin-antitoxin system
MDTNVFIGELVGREGHNRKLVRACFERRIQPLIGHTLFVEHLDVLSRENLFVRSPLSAKEREDLFHAFLSVCEWVRIYYSWRPNLRDEGDNHLLELAVAGHASTIVTNNISDFQASDLRFENIGIVTPAAFLKDHL